jgi:hypothetical protein
VCVETPVVSVPIDLPGKMSRFSLSQSAPLAAKKLFDLFGERAVFIFGYIAIAKHTLRKHLLFSRVCMRCHMSKDFQRSFD